MYPGNQALKFGFYFWYDTRSYDQIHKWEYDWAYE